MVLSKLPSPTLYAAAVRVQLPNILYNALMYFAAASVDFTISWRSSMFPFTFKPKERAVPGINCQYPEAPLGDVPDFNPLSTKGIYLKSSGIPCFLKIGSIVGNHCSALRCSLCV